ncbi:MAG: hypothetical protein HOP33_02035 [Verrucomicrobia bacterium]|nr:hypothetical protein [Verrucomicrobiota bacterium]
MKTLSLCALTLMISVTLATAEEKVGATDAALGSTTISGYVDTSVSWQAQTPVTSHQYEWRGWWRRFFQWLGFHGRN